MLYDLRLNHSMDIKRHLSLILLAVFLIFSCVQRQVETARDTTVYPTAAATEQLPTITVEALRERINPAGVATFILDVRTPEEYDGPQGHIEGAYLIPLYELGERLGELSAVKDRPIFVICHSGDRSAQATRILLDAGFRATSVAGGMQAWHNLIAEQPESVGDPS